MTRYLWMMSVTLFLFATCSFADAEKSLSPVGYWKTIDDVTGKPKAIVQIWQEKDKQLYGRILKIFPRPGMEKAEFCTACEGNKHNQKLIGLIILENLKQNKENQSLWSDGQILDPKNGKTYQTNAQLADNGKKLNVRGYIGVPLFGRTQTWLRVDNPTA